MHACMQAAAAARWDRWGESNHIGIHAAVMARAVSPDGATFTAPPDIEVVKAWGVHGAAPLPPNAAWRVCPIRVVHPAIACAITL